MSQFQYQWSDGTLTAIDLPTDWGHCDYKTPSSRMSNAHLEILASAGYTGAGLHEIEDYCIEAHAQLLELEVQARQVKSFWHTTERACQSWRCDAWCGCCGEATRWCRTKGIYCYMTNGELDSAYASWKNKPSHILASLSALESVWQETSAQIELDGQQATASALLDQLIAETNQMISLTAYQNEIREVEVKKKKTQEIFAPLMIVLILLGVGFYLYK